MVAKFDLYNVEPGGSVRQAVKLFIFALSDICVPTRTQTLQEEKKLRKLYTDFTFTFYIDNIETITDQHFNIRHFFFIFFLTHFLNDFIEHW
jgi:hypothetical protein